MRKASRIHAYTLGALTLLLGLGATYVQVRGIPTYPVQAPALRVVPDSTRVAEGKRLVGMTCAQCHRSADGTLSGRAFPGSAAMGESFFSANITQHPEAGIGRYECYSCHSASFQSVNLLDPEKTPGYLGDGNLLENWEGELIHSANLTPDRATGLGTWTGAQFSEALRFGKRPDGRPLRQPMTPYAAMTEAEAAAIWAYLQTVPAVQNPVDRGVM